ncbi:arginine-tRNA-protein transferase [Phenylobacterium zucineum HLK1]|uniref:Aspartate/glutamate leucyltransferase n=1 Tax=Phenylobacterium zucineum (strain HLK1) TaxID=450851 RepID=BPT_PHEZH|nr:arginyltransferase [Phenylobacterium zucineum]B4RBQ2.1 RecName: Full=Aspartate/glutamate leucyltransferase [Phenylobacterium zucineum HLK1]ACG78099.1 arginine-tRNA-protein transferase [Phenylobacterium zucineum HLK1]
MTQHFPTRQLRFFLTAPSPCPYLPERYERKVFAHLPLSDGATVNDSLTQVGFRRSQNIAYRPACEACSACVSARLPVTDYAFSRSERKVLARNEDLERHLVEAEATMEQFDLLRRYLLARHADGGMAEMTWPDYVAMVEDTAVRTHIIEYRTRPSDGGPGELVACALVDLMSDGLSLVYSFYDPTLGRRSLGSFVILDHVVQAGLAGLPYVYLGYWVRGSEKMDYKVRFSPIELLKAEGWTLMSSRDLRPKDELPGL